MESLFRNRGNWEGEDDLRKSYPLFFEKAPLNLKNEILLRGLEFVTPKNLDFNY